MKLPKLWHIQTDQSLNRLNIIKPKVQDNHMRENTQTHPHTNLLSSLL